ncbi:hypothetical protein JR334_11665 [Clostridia bacterium]|nr:hypothetical protein JR334_11665 [Clostridia bacterium]
MTILFLLLAALLILEFLLRSVEKKKRIQKMLGLEKEDLLDSLVGHLKEKSRSAKILEKASFFLAFMDWHVGGTSEKALVLLVFLLLVFCILLFLVLLVLGYGLIRSLLFLASAVLVSLILLYLLTKRGKERLQAELPQIYRLLSSRYLISGDMLESIQSLIPELHGGSRRIFENILQALQYNDLARRDEIFLTMMKTIDLEYFTLLLYIVRQACEKGGRKTILEQFVDLAEECLVEMQTMKELKALSRSYQVLLIILGVLYILVPVLNKALMITGANAYYTSFKHDIFTGFYLIVLLVFCFILQYLERTF